MLLVDPAACARAVVGGKAATLACLAQAGFPVPTGVVIPSGLALDERGADELLRTRFLPDEALAVRSTAFVEDGVDQSHAGQFRTVLNVRGPRALCTAIAAVRASYPHATTDGPVLVQRQVDAQLAGVCFTADPGSGIESLTVIEAVRGLGEALVSGRADPLYVRIDRRTHETVAARGFESGSPEGRAFLCVARQVADLAERAERALHAGPLDIEWAWDGERLWLLQARPITTATFPLPDRAPLTEPDVWFHGNFAETMPGAIPVLAWDVLQQAILRQALPLGAERVLRATDAQALDCLAGRVCWNVSLIRYWGVLNNRSLDLMALIDVQMAAAIRKLHGAGVIVLRREPTALQRGLLLLSLGLLGTRVLYDLVRAWRKGRVAAMEAMGASARGLIRCSGAESPDLLSPEEAWRRTQAMIRGMWPCLMPHLGTFKMLWLPLTYGTLAARWSGRTMAAVAGATLDQEPSWARRMDERMRALGRVLSEAGVVRMEELASGPERARDALSAFLAEFGHRAPGEQDLSRPRFRECPELVIQLALQAVQRDVARSGPELDGGRLQEEIGASGCCGSFRAALLRWLAPRAAQWAPVREDVKHVFWMPIWERLRTLILRTGQGLCERGVLGRAEDVFLFTCAELDALCAGHVTRSHASEWVERRRKQQARWTRFDFPPIIRSDGVPVTLRSEADDDVLRGTPVSGGVFEGPARIARSFEDALGLQPGEVLVATHLDPGWTVLFSRAGALVMEVGGVVSHAAVIARELGIPAVAGLTGATRSFTNGQRLRVDGRTGIVEAAEQQTDSG